MHTSEDVIVKDKQLTSNATIAKLAQTISATPTQAEVQAISTKVDAVIQKLIDAGVITAT